MCLAGGLSALLGLLGVACSQPSPPSVALISVSAAGPEILEAPALARLAGQSTVYEIAYTTAIDTLSAHASILTGLLPMQHGAGLGGAPLTDDPAGVPTPLAPHITTLAEQLADVGHRTIAVVGHPDLERSRGLDQGFDHYDDRGGDANAIAERAIEALASAGDAPFLLFVNFADLAEAQSISEYEARTERVDRAIAFLLDGLARQTGDRALLVALTADRGRALAGASQGWGSEQLSEAAVRVPLIVRPPGVLEPGSRNTTAKQNHRVHATILESIGLTQPGGVHLFPLDGRDTFIVTDSGRTSAAVRALYAYPYKLVHASTGEYALYDIVHDAGEVEDLSTEAPKPLSRLLKLLGQFSLMHPPLFDDRLADDANLWPSTHAALRALGDVE